MKNFFCLLALGACLLATAIGQTAGVDESKVAVIPEPAKASIEESEPGNSVLSGEAEDQAVAAPSMPLVGDGVMQFPVMRTLGGMGLVAFLLVAAYLGARKFAPRCFPKAGTDKNVKLIETLGMGDKRSIALIEVGHCRFLVGSTPNQINLLATLDDKASYTSQPLPAPGVEEDKPSGAARAVFGNLFEVKRKASMPFTGNAVPEDIRTKMRQLREALER